MKFENHIQKESLINIPNESHLSPIIEKQEQSRIISIGHEHICIINVFTGAKSASEVVCEAAIKKIFYNHKDNL